MTDRPKNSFDEIRQYFEDHYLKDSDMTFDDLFEPISEQNEGTDHDSDGVEPT